MSLNQCSLEKHFTYFSRRPNGILMTRFAEFECKPAKPSAIQRSADTSSATLLDRLPLELLHLICASLDFQSLSRLSRTSLQIKTIVELLPAYRDLMKYAPRTLSALGKTKLISLHSSGELHAALRSADCVSCAEFGTYLFLPTCERVCYGCLRRNQSFWMIAEATAKECFKIPQRQLKTISFTQYVPRHYQNARHGVFGQEQRLYAVKSVKRLAILIHGTNRKVTGLLPTRPPPHLANKPLREYYEFKWLLNAPMEPFQSDPLTIPPDGPIPRNEWFDTASIYFPHLASENLLESGLWCRGCDHLSRNLYLVGPGTLSKLVPRNIKEQEFFNGWKDRARTKDNFLKHIQTCVGVQMLITEPADTSRFR
ncbi:hypothetical protein TMatcc_006238 [Talaromyces marneffei ATCC 18224]|uniref:F-box domain-containing protein n=1 Tax=Talaromyces marneffei (strain ATCC 18224 / CBS 334.59 / QM 7333) TaxID=441960 RepID=B6QBX2_TALMQ|nr:conserved hypothetical protein [Talaromyces marneffei ATCC 18224]KAE8554254.1 hypothetical protein EYB25_002792 [Talaromyces marneffei]